MLNAVNILNPVNTLLAQGWLANEEAGQALYLASVGDASGAQAHAESSGAAVTNYVMGAVELGMTVAGGVTAARQLGVPGTHQLSSPPSAGMSASTEPAVPSTMPSAAETTLPNVPPKPKQTAGQLLGETTRIHNDTADRLASELNKLGVKSEHAGNKTIKNSTGKSIKGTEGTATTRKPDVVAEADASTKNTGIEVKTSEAPATVRKAADQLANEASFEGKGFFDGKPWTIGEGSGVVFTPNGLLHILAANPWRN